MKKTLATIFSTLFVLFSLAGCGANNPANSESYEGHPRIVTLQIVGFNDFHGNTLDSETGLGISKTASVINEVTNNKLNTIILSQGDMWQGSAESNLTKGFIVTDWMSEQGFVSMTLGNHEFDWGEDRIKENAAIANFPFLGINVYNRSTNERPDYCKPSVIVQKNGVKVGIIGAIGDCYSSIAASKVKDVYFKAGTELDSLVKYEAKSLKEQGCDIVIYSVHDDDSAYNTELSKEYVDIVFEGHTHKNYIRKDDKGVYHLQGAGYNNSFSYAKLEVDTKNDTFKVTDIKSIFTHDYTKKVEPEVRSEALFEKYKSIIGNVRQPIAELTKRYYSEDLRQLVSQLYLETGLEEWKEKYNIFLGGGYLSCRSPYHLGAGEVSYADIFNLFPFDNTIQLCSLKGSDLKSRFMETDNENYFITYSDYGRANQENVNLNDTYYIVCDNYCSDYAPNKLTVVEEYSDPFLFARDLLLNYVSAGNLA